MRYAKHNPLRVDSFHGAVHYPAAPVCHIEEKQMAKKQTFGLIVGNRGFFPGHLAEEGRDEMIKVIKKAGYEVVCLTPKDTKHGAVESREEINKCAQLFKKNADKIGGIIVTLPNFGDERGIADSIDLAGLGVPVLVQAYPDDLQKMNIANRRDSFCGKISVCNNLRQKGIPFTLTDDHTVSPSSDAFAAELEAFAGVCRIVEGLDRVRIGAVGARPAPFTTVRYSEKLLEESGISIETLDLSEVFGMVEELKDSDAAVKAKLTAVKDYVKTAGVPAEALMKMAKLGVVLERWMDENELAASAIQCWTSIEQYFGVTPCTVMSMMSDRLMPSACEVDVTGSVAMYALSLASQKPAALLDWNNNYSDDPDKCVLFHCSNLPKSVFGDVKMDYQEIIAGSVGKERAFGTCVGRMAPGPFTFARVSTDDKEGVIQAYVGEGDMTDDPLQTFGGYGVAHIEDLQTLMQVICQNGFEHHVAMTPASSELQLPRHSKTTSAGRCITTPDNSRGAVSLLSQSRRTVQGFAPAGLTILLLPRKHQQAET